MYCIDKVLEKCNENIESNFPDDILSLYKINILF